MKELLDIQQRLSVPKGQFNKHGSFKFRSLEDILEAVKPLLIELKVKMVITDELVNIGAHNYVKATVKLTNSTGDTEFGVGYAKEAEIQKGMQSAQLTGSTSSYARKYSASGLLLIDDNKDPDTNEFGGNPTKPETKKPAFNPDPVEEVIKTELGGRDMTAEAGSCKNNAELAVWYGNLPSDYKLEGSPVIEIKDARKKAIAVEQSQTDESAGATALDQVNASNEVKEGQMDYSFESLKVKTVAVLKQIAKEFEIAGFSKMDKPTLITSIIKKWEG